MWTAQQRPQTQWSWRITPAANPPLLQTREAYTDLAPSGQPMRLQRVCPAENRIEPWGQRATLRKGTGSEETYQEREDMLRETGLAEVNGARIYYEVAGEGDPLVLVHAGIADSRMWEDQLMAFADRYRVIRYDMRGFGMTAMVKGPFSHHEDLRALLDSLGVERANLVGCSMGGKTVLDFALEYPQKVGNLVLVGSAVGGFGPDIDPPRQWDEILAAEEAGDLKRVSELEVQVWVDGPWRSPEDVGASVRNLVREMNLIALRTRPQGWAMSGNRSRLQRTGSLMSRLRRCSLSETRTSRGSSPDLTC